MDAIPTWFILAVAFLVPLVFLINIQQTWRR